VEDDLGKLAAALLHNNYEREGSMKKEKYFRVFIKDFKVYQMLGFYFSTLLLRKLEF